MDKGIYTQDHRKIVKKLREAREDAGLTQIQVAKKLGFNQSYISKIETGQVDISVILLKRLAKCYKKDVEWFL